MAERTCSIERCGKPVLARGWCGMHYERWRRHGDALWAPDQVSAAGCSIDGCTRVAVARGWCQLHWRRWRKHGDPEVQPSPKAPKACAIEGCDRRAQARGWCHMHWSRWRRTGDPLKVRTRAGDCRIEDCSEPGDAGHGWCQKHYRRFQRHGDPMATSRIVGDDLARFESYVERTDTCWLWTGLLTADGYSVFPTVGEITPSGHRWAYRHFVGPIPEGLELDHLCRVRHCVNPEHLEPVTHAENLRRAREATRD